MFLIKKKQILFHIEFGFKLLLKVEIVFTEKLKIIVFSFSGN